eukprot:1075958-Rhodomonas_salina.2
MSVPTHQPHGNPPSGKYVPPAGTTGPRVGFSNAAIAHTPSLGCAALAEAMFGTSAHGAAGFGFQAFNEPEPEPELTAADLPEGQTDRPPGPTVGSLNYFVSATQFAITSNLLSLLVSWQSILMLIVLGLILFTGYWAAVCVSNVTNNFCMTLSSALVFCASLNVSDAVSVPRITAEEADKALNAMSDTVGAKDIYFLNSGCSYVMNSRV